MTTTQFAVPADRNPGSMLTMNEKLSNPLQAKRRLLLLGWAPVGLTALLMLLLCMNHFWLLANAGEPQLLDFWRRQLQLFGIPVALGLLAISFATLTVMRRQIRALEESLVRNRAVVDNLVEGVIHIDRLGQVIALNHSAECLFGYSKQEICGKRLALLFASPCRERYERAFALLGNDSSSLETGISIELTGVRRDHSTFPLQFSLSAVRSDGINLYTALIRDLSEQRRTLNSMQEARDAAMAADLAKSQFLANMSHEIRTPLNGVVGMLDLLKDTALQPGQLEFAETAQRSSQALLNIINDILDFSKIEAGKMTLENIDFDLRENVEEITTLLSKNAHGKGLEMICYVSPDVPETLRGDPYRLRQILINLIGNAIKFTEHGEVFTEVSIEQDFGDDVLLRFAVKDTGIGIDPVTQQHLFQPFSQADGSTTRRYGGTGLGLAICKRLVGLMGGNIGVTSLLAQGSCFWFTVRCAKSKRKRARSNSPLERLQVLIVDDNASNRRILEKTLANWGMLTTAVDSGRGAMNQLRTAQQQGTAFDLAILDMQMPQMNGIQLAHSIKSDPTTAATRLIMLSSNGFPGPEAKEAGVACSLVKPVRQALLRDALYHVLTSDNPAPAKTSSHTRQKRFQGRILLVEDNPVNQRVMQKMLEKIGLVSNVAKNGAEAIAALRNNTYDLVLMDIQMPVMDGLEATRRIRQAEVSDIHVPIMAMTASAMKSDQEECFAVGMDDYLAKPINQAALAEKLARWLPAA